MMKKSLLLLLLTGCLSLNAQDEKIFEQLALQGHVERIGLEKNPRPILPEVYLNWDSQVQSPFKASDKMTTQEQLNKELSRMRKYYSKFMKDYAPKLPVIRPRTYLKEFDWCLLASEIKEKENGDWYPVKEMTPVAEKWEKVTIPHYTGPIDKAEGVYRRQLNISSSEYSKDKIFLHFNAVDYIAEIYVNDKFVGKHIGLFGAFEFDIKPFLKEGSNDLKVKIFNDAVMMGDNYFLGPEPPRKFGKKLAGAGSPGWDEPYYGWRGCPPGFGIWQSCYIETRNDAYIKDIYVRPSLKDSKAIIQVEVDGDMSNCQLQYSLYGQNFKSVLAKNITVPKSSSKYYKFEILIPFNQLKVWSLNTPWLYQLQLIIKENGKVVDAAKQQFGMRSFVQSMNSTPKGRYYLNGKEIKMRGANMMGNLMQCVIRGDYDQLMDDILIAKIVGMNYWRMTQQPCQEEVYDYFDKLGLLAQTDMPCFNGYRGDCLDEVKTQFVEMMKLIRNHPCNAVITYCNEIGPKPGLIDYDGHRDLFMQFDLAAEKLNPGQATKWIEGDYPGVGIKFSDHHCYDTWYGDSMKDRYFGEWFPTFPGWMYGCGEFGAEGLDTYALMKKYYLKDWLKTDSQGKWDPNNRPSAQTGTIGRKWLNIKEGTFDDWISQSREFQMYATRLFTESLRRNPRMGSFSVHLLIDAWPSSWMKAIVDVDRHAKPAYFAYKDALSPVAVNLRPDAFYGFSGEKGRTAIFVCNDTPETLNGCQLRYQIEKDGKVLSTGHSLSKVPASEPVFQGYVEYPYPEVSDRTKIVLRVGLFDSMNKMIHESSYDLDVFPASAKGQKLDYPGGYPQRLIK